MPKNSRELKSNLPLENITNIIESLITQVVKCHYSNSSTNSLNALENNRRYIAAQTRKIKSHNVDSCGMIERPLNAMKAIGPPALTTVRAIQEIASIPIPGSLN